MQPCARGLNYDATHGYQGPEQRVDLTPSSPDGTLDQTALGFV